MGDFTRRDLMRAGAWSVPVVVLAAAAPTAAASTAETTANLLYVGIASGEHTYRVIVDAPGEELVEWPYEAEVLELDSATYDVYVRGTLDANGIAFFTLTPEAASSHLAVRAVILKPSGDVLIAGPLSLPPV
ncbi:hypothetical protein [Herbiconiux sp. A18JL235]|uniref:Uncharacterized protein n=1 Tax=Herbiconiux sp. A18JL235 TaxID=3152363 RepID=A0AB39BLJ3_9MICO